mmetsp:Transcript_150161/g.280035  ORF Transcript_150161/g.280035 Transcript_150161/m.280035 type:complete len:536 (-) Transcript_150161:49-1656(-)
MFAPSKAVSDPGTDDDSDVADPPWFEWHKFMKYCGPGFLMCIAYLDPGNLEADLQQGAYAGFTLTWLLLLAHLSGFLIQLLSARLGNATGMNLAQVCRRELPYGTSLLVYVMVELAIIGADIQEVLGTAVAWQILFNVPLWVGCCLTGFDAFILLLADRYGERKLEFLVALLVGTMTICFWINFAHTLPDISTVGSSLVPKMPEYAIIPGVGTIGAVIMPHNIYLYSALVLSRRVDRRRDSKIQEANKYCTFDAGLALVVCFFINFAVVGCFAQNFFTPTCAHAAVPTACIDPNLKRATWEVYGQCTANGRAGVCSQIGLRSAGDALQASLGNAGRYVWAIGLLAAGLSSTMTTTYAGQFVMEGFLNLGIPAGARTVITRIVALMPAIYIARAAVEWGPLADSVGQWLNVMQSVLLPFALLPILIFTDSEAIMGRHRNDRLCSYTCWFAALLVMAANAYLVVSLCRDSFEGYPGQVSSSPLLLVVLLLVGVVYTVSIFIVGLQNPVRDTETDRLVQPADMRASAEQASKGYGADA